MDSLKRVNSYLLSTQVYEGKGEAIGTWQSKCPNVWHCVNVFNRGQEKDGMVKLLSRNGVEDDFCFTDSEKRVVSLGVTD